MPLDEYPRLPEAGNHFAGHDDAVPMLEGVLITYRPGVLLFTSTDRYRMAMSKTPPL